MPSTLNDRIREIIRILDNDKELPTLSPVVEKVLRLIGDEKVAIGQLAKIIQNDVSLSFRILKVVNSAFYGFTRKISTVSQAMVILGLSAVKNLALSMSILEIIIKETSSDEKSSLSFKTFWERSLFAAVTARRLATLVKYPAEEEVFMAGLLQDVGVLVFIKHFPDEYARLLEDARSSALDPVTVEDQNFGINHTLLGEFLANKWRLPRSLTIPILRHHDPEKAPLDLDQDDAEDMQKRTYFVHLSHLVSMIFYDEYRPDYVIELKKKAHKYFNLDHVAIEELLDTLDGEVKEVADFFGLSLQGIQSYSELLAAANIELGKLNLSYEQMNKELIAAKRRTEELAVKLSEANRKLEEMANLDGLTQIFNRRVFENTLTREFYRSNRYGHPLSCIMIDLDHFKNINDTEGHLVGDHVLREMASLLQKLLRKSDFLARYGGEEFVVISPETNNAGAKILAEKLRDAVENHAFDIEGRTLRITISLGVATFTSETDMEREDQLVEKADKNLYRAKSLGRNRIWTDVEEANLPEETPAVPSDDKNTLLTT
jgi:diguanylate cyclase (GGDEF)-like protein